jgi:hypothetical protein
VTGRSGSYSSSSPEMTSCTNRRSTLVASVETFVTVSRGLRRDALRWAACLASVQRVLTARVPAGRRVAKQLTFGVVEYPREPTQPGEQMYRFVLAHTATASVADDKARQAIGGTLDNKTSAAKP